MRPDSVAEALIGSEHYRVAEHVRWSMGYSFTTRRPGLTGISSSVYPTRIVGDPVMLFSHCVYYGLHVTASRPHSSLPVGNLFKSGNCGFIARYPIRRLDGKWLFESEIYWEFAEILHAKKANAPMKYGFDRRLHTLPVPCQFHLQYRNSKLYFQPGIRFIAPGRKVYFSTR